MQRTADRNLLVLAFTALIVFPAFRSARMLVPEGLSAAAAAEVTGKNPRTWNRPLGFAAYRTSSVREGVEFSWSVELFGVRGGSATKAYRLVLDGPDGEALEVECRTRSIEAWRGGFSVDLTGAFTPLLVCGASPREGGSAVRLVLGRSGQELRGVLQEAGSERTLFAVRSLHRLEGARLRTPEPVGYVLERDGGAVAAVETINRGRVWLGPTLEGTDRGRAAATVAALLLFDPELAPSE